MKVGSDKPQSLVDLNQVKKNKEKSKASNSEVSPSALKKDSVKDPVELKLSQTLDSLTKAISESELSLGEVHSGVDTARLQRVFESLERVEAQRPRLSQADLDSVLHSLEDKMIAQPRASSAAFVAPSAERVADLLSEPV